MTNIKMNNKNNATWYRIKNSIEAPNSERRHLSDEEIKRELQIIQEAADHAVSTYRRQLQDPWSSYCLWLETCENLHHSQSQRHYYDAKKRFRISNTRLIERNHHPIPRSKFQPPLPRHVRFLETISKKLVKDNLGISAYFSLILLIAQLALNIVYITKQFITTLNFHQETFQNNTFIEDMISTLRNQNIVVIEGPSSSITSISGIGHLIEFIFLCLYSLTVFIALASYFRSYSILNRGIMFQDTVIAIEKTANFSLFKFIHYINLSTFVNEFHDPPFLGTLSDFVAFTWDAPNWEPFCIGLYKLLYALVARPILAFLGILALYVKLLQVTSSLQYFSMVTFSASFIQDMFDNASQIFNFMGLANNIAGLYGRQRVDERTIFFDAIRIHEYDFLHAMLRDFIEEQKYWRGYWNIILYSISIGCDELREAFWGSVYGGTADIFEEKPNLTESPMSSPINEDQEIGLKQPMQQRRKRTGGSAHLRRQRELRGWCLPFVLNPVTS